MESFILREQKSLEKSDDTFFVNFFNKFKYNNVFKKEKYSIFIPLKISREYFSVIKNKDLSNDIKIVRYSFAEKLMSNPINFYTKDFDKDCLYLGFLNEEGIDWDTLSNKIVWDKAANYLAIFKVTSIDIDINYNKPLIILKHIKNNKTKIENFWMKSYHSKFTDNLFSLTISYDLIDQLKTGKFGLKSSKFKSFLRAKSSFNNSINPIKRVNLSARSIELFLKYPYKKGYGGLDKTQKIADLTKQVIKNMLFNHSIYLLLINKSAILKYGFKNNKSKIYNLKEKINDFEIKNFRKEVLNLNITEIKDHWTKNVIKEIQGVEKLPIYKKDDFQVFLYLCAIFVTLERNQQIHNKAKYDLKDILLSEIVDSIVSISVQNVSYQIKKSEYNKNKK